MLSNSPNQGKQKIGDYQQQQLVLQQQEEKSSNMEMWLILKVYNVSGQR